MLTNGGRIMFDQIVLIEKKNTNVEFKNMFNLPARYPFKLEVYSLNYKGLDYIKEFQLDVKELSETRNVITYNIENIKGN
jgi:hypothetical protein